MPPNKRPIISKYPGNNVSANDIDITTVGGDPIPEGKQLRITCFGGAMAKVGKIELQIRTKKAVVAPDPPAPAKWRTLRCVIGPGHGHYENLQPIEGDDEGVTALRIVRTNDEATNEKINAWVEGIRR